MKLIGNYLSPYTRRVAVTMRLFGLSCEMDTLSAFVRPETVKEHNPLVRIPVLVLDDGEAVFESSAILDAIDELAADAAPLVPPHGPLRRKVLRIAALATGVMEKSVQAFYEGRFHPPGKVHEPWVEHNDGQVLGGLEALNEIAAQAGSDDWLAGTPDMTQADITAAIAFTFTTKVRRNLDIVAKFPDLAAFTERCEALPEFAACPVPDKPPG